MYEELTALNHSKATEYLIQFWLKLPREAGRVCPKRADFSSAQINGALPEVFLSEWQDDKLVVVQAGTVLDRLIGLDMTGRNIFDILPEPLRIPETLYYRQLRDQPCAGMISRSTIDFRERPFVYRTIQLPLMDPFGKVRYFVGTGYEVPRDELIAKLGAEAVDHTNLVEREFFDIGAGVPDSKSDTAGDAPSQKL
ncbi:PAS domain-containing protein [Kordiimonas marina]|uniref:PAS domain-containing protein n=1 Tax=Kordiimonas marina TaxID=2872312 RepID=UPI001FF5677B|nr:PAS domain-containing protein [Kordiimonas marina]MCJ9429723.1 PAS domain-containing protein [Kordiimonas marina]